MTPRLPRYFTQATASLQSRRWQHHHRLRSDAKKRLFGICSKANYDAFADLLAADFMEVEPDNVYDKAASVKGVSMFNAAKAVLSDFKTVNIDADAAIVTYSVTNPGVTPGPERHSSIWVNRNGKWMGLFHHGGTPVVKAPRRPHRQLHPRWIG